MSKDLQEAPSGRAHPSSCRDDIWRRIFDDLAAGRLAALEDLYDVAGSRIHDLALWRTGSAADAADVMQDVFVRVAGHGERLARIRNPRAWLLTVTHRAAVDVIRRGARRRAEPVETCPYLTADTADADRVMDARRASELLTELPSTQRTVIYLRHFASCTFAEIGRIVGVPKFTAASRYRNGVARLRRLMEGKP